MESISASLLFGDHETGHLCSPNQMYYSQSLMGKDYKFVFLDGFDISTIGASSLANCDLAWQILCRKNPNMCAITRTCKGGDYFLNLDKDCLRYVPYNGSISVQQLEWLRKEINDADEINQKVIIFCHVPCCESGTTQMNVLWNFNEVLDIMHKSQCVVAYIAGHDHCGSYALDEYGIHHITLPAPLECDEGEISYGYMDINNDNMVLTWSGKTGSCWPDCNEFGEISFQYNRKNKA
jgi:manganese-dependent ADP-ribose/CDP-alcohol diphosphatase